MGRRTLIAWGPCDDPGLAEARAECGTVRVPLDYGRLHGRKISLAVSRIRHTSSDADYQGVMLVKPGGPGGSGLGLAVLGQFAPDNAAAPTTGSASTPAASAPARPR